MTILELLLICVLCYILIGVIWAIAHFLKSCKDIEKLISQDNGNYLNTTDYECMKPTTIDGIIIIFCWSFYLLYFIGVGITTSINIMTDFLEKHGM